MNEFIPNIKKLELAITYRCNLKCRNCSNLCTQAPCNFGDITLDQVYKLLNESVEYNHKWEWITLHGGESVLRDDFLEICQLMSTYKEIHNPEVYICVASNGSTYAIKQKLKAAKNMGIEPAVAYKVVTNKDGNGNDIPYIPVNESPSDLKLPYTLGCFQTRDCGICLNYLGFFVCSPAAAAARVFDYEPVCTSVKDLSVDKLAAAFQLQCMHCGFAMPNRRRVIDQTTTYTWESALKHYNMMEGNLCPTR